MPDEASLRVLIGCLEQKIAAAEVWMYVWTALVILGCAGELYFVIHAYMEERKTWFRARTQGNAGAPEKPSLIILIVEVLSVALVVIGISGELYIDWDSGDLQTQLRSANGNLILLLEKEAGEAKKSALEAAGAAERAKLDAGDAIAKADKVRRTVDLVSEHADQLAQAEEREIAERTKAVKAVSPRYIKPDSLAILRQFGPLQYILRCDGDPDCKGEGEPQQFADKIELGFDLLNWTRLIPNGPKPSIDPTVSAILGVIIPPRMFHSGVDAGCSDAEADTSPCVQAAHLIVDTLNGQGLSATYTPRLERLPSQTLLLDVWKIPTEHDRKRIQAVWEQSKQMRTIQKP